MVVNLRYELVTPKSNSPARLFELRLRNRVGPEFDNIHKQVAINLTRTSKDIIERSIVRPQERGQRKKFRRTGTLTGHSGRRSAIKAEILNKGGGQRQNRGVGFPDVALLNRRAAHWRAQEYGVDSVKLPTGVFIAGGEIVPLGGAPGVFHTYGEALRATGLTSRRFGLSSRSRQARTRRVGGRDLGGRQTISSVWKKGEARGYPGKFYLRGSWDQVVGDNGRNIALRYENAIDKAVGDFRLR